MKTYKKILFGLSLLISLVISGLLTHHVLAAPAAIRTCEYAACSESDITGASYKFLDESTIEGVFRDGKTVRFTDADGPDKGPFGKFKHAYVAPKGAFCSGGFENGSITISDDEWKKVGFGDELIFGNVDIDYDDITQKVKTCVDFEAVNMTITNLDGAASDSYTWDSGSLVSYGKGITLTDSGDGLLYQEKSGCDGWIVVLKSKGGNLGTEYELTDDFSEINGKADANKYLPQYFKDKDKCWIKNGPNVVNISGKFDEPAPGGGNNPGNNFRGSATPSCESNFSFGFEWFLCPALEQMDNAAGALNSFVEDQLCVNTGPVSDTAGGVKCGGDEILSDQAKDAWSGFRVIATSLLVIVLLVAIISQSTGIGPVDAYTLRKMLPRIVAAVILIQISWYLAKFAVDLSNDLGKGIQSLLYAPFGGVDNMRLDDLIGKSIGTATGEPDVFALFLVLAAATAIVVSLPGLILLGFYVVLALFVAFFVLLLRKIFILLLAIVLPLALIAWLIPNTEKYWKNWSTNFTKLLLMFPMIMALIAGGRIFAYLATDPLGVILRPQLATYDLGPLPVPYLSAVGDFATLAIIILAFFAPYFLLPMTFKWGGSVMGMIGDAVRTNGLTRRMKEGTKGYTDDLDKRIKGNLANRYSTTGRGIGGIMKRRAIGVATGKTLPTERNTRRILAQGFEYKDDLVKGKQAIMQNDYSEVLEKTNSVGKSKEFIRDKYAWSSNPYDQRAFHNWLIDTKSGMELEDTNWRTHNSKGEKMPDIAKTSAFISALHADPARYAYIAQNLPIFQPFNSEIGGGPKPTDYLGDGGPDGGPGKRYKDVVDDETGEITKHGRPAQNAAQAQLFADDERFVKWLESVNDPRELASVRPGMYQMMKEVDDGLGGQSRSAQILKNMLEESAQTLAGQQAIQPLAGGGAESAKKHIDGMLGGQYLENLLSRQPGGAISVDEMSEAVARGMRAGQQTGSGRQAAAESGTLIIEHQPKVIRPQPGESVSPGGVILTPGAQRNLEDNPPSQRPPESNNQG